MFGWWEKFRNVVVKVTPSLLLIIALASCGSAPVPPPLPPPAPSSTTGTGYVGGSCGGVSGTPFNQSNTPYFGNLYALNGGYGGAGDTIALSLYSLGQASFDTYVHNVVGTAQMNMPSLIGYTPYPSSTQNTNFCVSSSTINGGQPTPGIFSSGDLSVQMVLQGVMQIPLYSGYSGYPGGFYPGSNGSQMGQEMVQLNIGMSQSCPAYIYQGRIVGCIDVAIGPPGSNSTRIRYVAQ